METPLSEKLPAHVQFYDKACEQPHYERPRDLFVCVCVYVHAIKNHNDGHLTRPYKCKCLTCELKHSRLRGSTSQRHCSVRDFDKTRSKEREEQAFKTSNNSPPSRVPVTGLYKHINE